MGEEMDYLKSPELWERLRYLRALVNPTKEELEEIRNLKTKLRVYIKPEGPLSPH